MMEHRHRADDMEYYYSQQIKKRHARAVDQNRWGILDITCTCKFITTFLLVDRVSPVDRVKSDCSRPPNKSERQTADRETTTILGTAKSVRRRAVKPDECCMGNVAV